MSCSARPFEPASWAFGGHRQTVLGHWSRRRLTWSPPTEDVLVDGEPDVRLLLRVSWQPGVREERPAVVLVHGLGGSDRSGYTLATGALAFDMGWHVVRMNMRGAGDSVRHCPRLYNAGLACDLLAVLDRVGRQVPRVVLVGFSLGGNLALLTLGREARHVSPNLVAAAAVSPALDLSACAAALERPGNRGYQVYFMRGLRRAYRERVCSRPDLFEPGRDRGTRSVREYDERITAFYGGYASAADYYARASAGPWLASIERPTLILSARDDPMIPWESMARWPLPTSDLVTRDVAPSGGHVGFVAPTNAPGRFWAAERVLSYLAQQLHASVTPGAPQRG